MYSGASGVGIMVVVASVSLGGLRRSYIANKTRLARRDQVFTISHDSP